MANKHHMGVIGRGNAVRLRPHLDVPDHFLGGHIDDMDIIPIGIGLPHKLTALG